MLSRALVLHSIAVIAVFAFSLVPIESWATNDTLYGLTYDGYLVQINKTTAGPTLVRSKLPANYQPYHSLTFYNGSFLASAGPTLATGGCWLVSFGVQSNDLVYNGATSGMCPHALTVDGSNNVFTAGSSTCGSATCLQIKQINMSTFALSNIANALSLSGYVSHDYPPVTGLTFVGTTDARMANVAYGANNITPLIGYWELASSGGAWSSTYHAFGNSPPSTHGLTTDPTASTATYFAVSGYDDHDNSVLTSQLYTDTVPDSAHLPSFVGTISGYPGMVGIVFAPQTSQISSPPQPTGAKDLEPIRELLFD